jgi:hypothetical protein
MASARTPAAIVVSPQPADASESEDTTLGISPEVIWKYEGMNFAVCPDDDSKLKVVTRPSSQNRNLIMSCPICSKRFTLGSGGPVEIRPGDQEGQAT